MKQWFSFDFGRWEFTLGFEPRDIWIGVFWDYEWCGYRDSRTWRIYTCLVPCVVFTALRKSSYTLHQGSAAKACRCCDECERRPCDGTLAGGPCDQMRCRCRDEDYELGDEDEFPF